MLSSRGLIDQEKNREPVVGSLERHVLFALHTEDADHPHNSAT